MQKELPSIQEAFKDAPSTQLDARMVKLIKKFSNPPKAVEILEVLDWCAYGSLASGFVMKMLHMYLEEAKRREGITQAQLEESATYREDAPFFIRKQTAKEIEEQKRRMEEREADIEKYKRMSPAEFIKHISRPPNDDGSIDKMIRAVLLWFEANTGQSLLGNIFGQSEEPRLVEGLEEAVFNADLGKIEGSTRYSLCNSLRLMGSKFPRYLEWLNKLNDHLIKEQGEEHAKGLLRGMWPDKRRD